MMEFWKWLVGVVAGVILAAFTQWVAYTIRVREEHRRRVADIHSDFVGAVSEDLKRAKTVKATLDIGFAPSFTTLDDGFHQWIDGLVKVDSPRHVNRKDLARLATLLEIFESNRQIVDEAKRLCDAQPFFFHQPFSATVNFWNSEGRRKQEEKFASSLEVYSKLLKTYCAQVSAKYGRKRWRWHL